MIAWPTSGEKRFKAGQQGSEPADCHISLAQRASPTLDNHIVRATLRKTKSPYGRMPSHNRRGSLTSGRRLYSMARPNFNPETRMESKAKTASLSMSVQSMIELEQRLKSVRYSIERRLSSQRIFKSLAGEMHRLHLPSDPGD
jgi:hypothetical protein